MQWALLSVGSRCFVSASMRNFLTPTYKCIGTLGSLVSFGINFNASALQVPVSVYVVFIILMVSGFFVACFTILPPSRIRRPDGTPLAHYPHEGFWHELKAQSKLFSDWRLLVLFVPLFGSEIVVIVFSSLNCEWLPYSLQFKGRLAQDLRLRAALYFNIRTRSLNSVCSNLMQIVGAIWIGILLDNRRFGSRRTRGFVSIAAVSVIVIAGWIGITVWLYKNPLDPLNPPLLDWTDGPFGGFFVLNLIFGMNLVVVSRILHLSCSSMLRCKPY